MIDEMNDMEEEIENLRNMEIRMRHDMHDLLKSLYLTFKIEELTLKNARSLIEIASDRIRPQVAEEMDHD